MKSIDFKELQRSEIARQADEILTEEVLKPAQNCMNYNREVIDTSNKALNQTAKWMRIGFLFLGLCGALAGLVLGVGVALNLRRTMVRLQVSVKGVAGRLTEVLGPVTLSEGTTMQELQLSLQAMEQHIAEVVERLQKQELEILRREQLASLGQIAAGMAHELRNPLMPMKMLVQAEVQKGENGPGLKGRSLKVLNDEIMRLETSIQTFLDFARPPQLDQSDFDIRELCEQTLELVQVRAEQQDVRLIHEWPEDQLLIHADPHQIRQVVLNLVLNALDALPQGGEIVLRVRARRGELPDPDLDRLAEFTLSPPADSGRTLGELVDDLTRHGLSPPDFDEMLQPGWCVVSVSDSGTGIDPALVDRIFEPFVTTKETGHGLGLSTCRRIIHAHGGSISVANRPEGGAVFTFCVKMAKARAQRRLLRS